MKKELRELLGKLDEKEIEMKELREAGKVREAHEMLQEVRDLEMAIEVAKQEEKREKAMTPPAKKGDEGMEHRDNKFESMEYRQAFIKYISGQKDSLSENEVRALSVSSAGGAVVPTTIHSTIQQLLKQFSPVRRLASVLTSSSNLSINIESAGGTASWTAEAGVIGESNPTVRAVNFNAYKLATMVKMSNELIADNVVNIENYIAEKIAEAFIDAEGDAFLNGDGVGKPTGLTTAAFPSVVSKTTLKVAYDDIVKLYTGVLPKYRVNGSWLVSNDVFAQLLNLVDGQGRPLLIADIQNGGIYNLFGRPVEVDPKLPAFDAIGKKSVYFGDFKRAYQIVDRAEMTMRTSTERFIDSDQTAVVATKRTDGQPMDLTALVVLESK